MMAKSKGPQGVPNKHIYSRASYLYQAASLLAASTPASPSRDHKAQPEQSPRKFDPPATSRMSRRLLEDMRSVSLKAQIRQSPTMKQSICKFCDTLLIEGQTCRSSVENASKSSKKPWADVLVMKCSVCGGVKRYPVSVPKQMRKGLRSSTGKDEKKLEVVGEDGGDTSMIEAT